MKKLLIMLCGIAVLLSISSIVFAESIRPFAKKDKKYKIVKPLNHNFSYTVSYLNPNPYNCHKQHTRQKTKHGTTEHKY